MAIENYELLHWKDYPDISTPLMQALLNHMDEAIGANRDGIIQLDEETLNLVTRVEKLTEDYLKLKETEISDVNAINRNIVTIFETLSQLISRLDKAIDDIDTHENKLRNIDRDLSSIYLELGEIFSQLAIMPKSYEVYVGEEAPTDWQDLKLFINTDEIYMENHDIVTASEVILSNSGAPEGTNTIRFGKDENGNYGYYKAGADTLIPFKQGGRDDRFVIFSEIYGDNDLESILEYIGSSASGSVISKTDNLIMLQGTNNKYTVNSSPIIYKKIDLTNYAYIYVRVSRANTNGRMYLFVTDKELDELGSVYLTGGIPSPGKSSYISDSANLEWYSLNVQSCVGIFNVCFANAANNETYIHEFRLL